MTTTTSDDNDDDDDDDTRHNPARPLDPSARPRLQRAMSALNATATRAGLISMAREFGQKASACNIGPFACEIKREIGTSEAGGDGRGGTRRKRRWRRSR